MPANVKGALKITVSRVAWLTGPPLPGTLMGVPLGAHLLAGVTLPHVAVLLLLLALGFWFARRMLRTSAATGPALAQFG
jgi:hypothetical protein